MSISYEIDFLPVDDGQRGGDAICMRYGLPGCYKVMVYDGGTRSSGKALVRHIRDYYGTNVVDHVVCSHPDADHVAGLIDVLEKMEVASLWMHRPWEYSAAISNYVEKCVSGDTCAMSRLQASLVMAHTLEQTAVQRGVPIHEPFQGQRIGEFTVLSPNRLWYVIQLIADMEHSLASGNRAVASSDSPIWKVIDSARQVFTGIAESWGFEMLRESVSTSPENDSSIVLFGMPADRGVLLTGDAGPRALTASTQYAQSCAILLPEVLKFVQIPHHGSRHNVSPWVLDRLIGQKLVDPLPAPKLTAFASVGKHCVSHPRQAVVNAFIRRGAKVIATKGDVKSHRFNMESRRGWVPIAPLDFSPDVESWP